MSRNFGMSRRTDARGQAISPALSRAGAARDLSDHKLRENVTAGFVGVFLVVPVAVLYGLCKLVDWVGVGERFYSLCNFG